MSDDGLVQQLRAKFDKDKSFNKEKFVKIIDLLQQDRHGKTTSFSDKQMTEIARIATVKQRLGESTIEKVVESLTSEKLAKMFQINKKQMASFILKLNTKQIHALAQFLIPFLNAYSDLFIDSLSDSQLCVVWDVLWPTYLDSIVANKLEAEFLGRLGWGRPEIASALEFAEAED